MHSDANEGGLCLKTCGTSQKIIHLNLEDARKCLGLSRLSLLKAVSGVKLQMTFETGIVDKATFDQHVPAHKAFVRELIVKGHQAQSGYWAHQGGGMMLFEAAICLLRRKQLWLMIR